MIRRLRDLPDRDVVYAEPHDHRLYGLGHHLRVETTVVVGESMVHAPMVVADLSCGNGVIATRLAGQHGTAILGDYAPGWPITGPVETTIAEIPAVDLFVLSETIEHVDDPATVLHLIRTKAAALLLSTPLDCWDDANGEHLWAWDRAGIEGLLNDTGWTVTRFASLDSRVFGEPYLYGVFGATRRLG